MTTAVVFPFDTFGNSGTADGARLLGDLLHEILDDTARETRKVRQSPLVESLHVEELTLDTMQALSRWRESGREIIREQLKEKEFLIWLSGNHLGVLPVYEELSSLDCVVQLDAHLDCYDLHDTQQELSHGNWLRQIGPGRPRIVQLGHRDLFLTPIEIRNWFDLAIPATELHDAKKQLKRPLSKARRVWIDLDVDVFDPSICPAVHSPLPCGITGLQFVSIVEAIGIEKLAGISISEFDPGRDVRDSSLSLLGWLLEWIVLRQQGL